jgi:hypothetical protein
MLEDFDRRISFNSIPSREQINTNDCCFRLMTFAEMPVLYNIPLAVSSAGLLRISVVSNEDPYTAAQRVPRVLLEMKDQIKKQSINFSLGTSPPELQFLSQVRSLHVFLDC